MVELPARDNQATARRLEDVLWREKVRTEDLAERDALRLERGAAREERDIVRAEDVAWREKARAADLAEREAARAEREIMRAEDLAWREKTRAEDRAERDAFRVQTLRGLAFLAAAQNAKSGTPVEELARRAQEFAKWIGDVVGKTDQRT
jgi:hypothetical protein